MQGTSFNNSRPPNSGHNIFMRSREVVILSLKIGWAHRSCQRSTTIQYCLDQIAIDVYTSQPFIPRHFEIPLVEELASDENFFQSSLRCCIQPKYQTLRSRLRLCVRDSKLGLAEVTHTTEYYSLLPRLVFCVETFCNFIELVATTDEVFSCDVGRLTKTDTKWFMEVKSFFLLRSNQEKR